MKLSQNVIFTKPLSVVHLEQVAGNCPFLIQVIPKKLRFCVFQNHSQKSATKIKATSYFHSLSNSNCFLSAKICWCKSCIIDFTSAKMEFASAIFKKLYFSKYSIKWCCKQITSIQKLVCPYKYILNGVMITGRLSIT